MRVLIEVEERDMKPLLDATAKAIPELIPMLIRVLLSKRGDGA